jgi:hypothetical protein
MTLTRGRWLELDAPHVQLIAERFGLFQGKHADTAVPIAKDRHDAESLLMQP